MASIEVRNLTKRFGGIMALDDIELRVPDGSFVVLLGPTGAGKTTLLRVIAGLEKPDEGHVVIDDMDCTQQTPAERNVRHGVSTVFAVSTHVGPGESRVSFDVSLALHE